jgi:hypothetical protein
MTRAYLGVAAVLVFALSVPVGCGSDDTSTSTDTGGTASTTSTSSSPTTSSVGGAGGQGGSGGDQGGAGGAGPGGAGGAGPGGAGGAGPGGAGPGGSGGAGPGGAGPGGAGPGGAGPGGAGPGGAGPGGAGPGGSGGAGGGMGGSGSCTDPILAADPSTQIGTTVGADNASSGIDCGAFTAGGGPELIYEVTPAITGVLNLGLTIEDPMVDLGLYVESTCGDPASVLACMDNGGNGTSEVLQVPVTAGVPLYVYVDGYEAADASAFMLDIQTVAPACGDGFVQAGEECEPPNSPSCDAACQIVVAASCALATPAMLGNNTGNTTNGINSTDTDNTDCQVGGGFEQVFTFTPAMAGTMTLMLTSNEDLGVYVRTNCSDPTTEIACEDSLFTIPATEVLTIPVVAGVPLFIIVDGYLPGVGDLFTLNVAQP